MGKFFGQCKRCGGAVRPEHVCPQDVAADFVIPIVPYRGDPVAGRDIVGIDRAEFDRRLAAHTESLRSETARLRALLDERTALLRECLRPVETAALLATTEAARSRNTDLADRVREAIKETT